MNVYIWSRVANLTENFHNEGGLVVVAPSLEKARAFMLDWGVRSYCKAHTTDPDASYTLATGGADVPALFIFPDAGCC